MSAKCRAWSKFGRDVTSRTLPKVAFYAGWDAARGYYFPASEHSEQLDLMVVPGTPEPECIDSMCLRYDHGFGLKRHIYVNELGGYRDETEEEFEQRRNATRATMRQLYEEATGQGFFQR